MRISETIFCCKSEKKLCKLSAKKYLTRICVFTLTEKNKKELKNSDEHIAKNVRNVGKIRLYEKVSVK